MKNFIHFLFLMIPSIGFSQVPTQPNQTQIPTTVDEIRIIPCSQARAQDVDEIERLIKTTVDPRKITEEKSIPPPQQAIDRLNDGITIRYFDPVTLDAATKFKQALDAKYQGGQSVNMEDMRLFYPTPMSASLTNYLEVWLK